ncbi:MAG: hypothetical protein ACOC8K_01975 [Gemmatimonadota bacterium]
MKIVATRKDEQNRAAVDPWTLVHFSTGLALGLVDAPFDKVLGGAVGYEIAEQFAERHEWGQDLFETSGPEHLVNAAVDVGVFLFGHWLGQRWNRS